MQAGPHLGRVYYRSWVRIAPILRGGSRRQAQHIDREVVSLGLLVSHS
ncbi:hypothetical protein IEO21_07255 [Rhodonia placenta]|uniref:Uncharacterized protein n=1 Tax=Rhodonia placenta TaxID=104341 RepID=A0A8H7NYK0_9APHY|nr:hypothetical protein IEO21_07255 [Postia placenta]